MDEEKKRKKSDVSSIDPEIRIFVDFYFSCTAEICFFLDNFAVLLGNFKIRMVIWPWKTLNRKKRDDDNLIFKVPKLKNQNTFYSEVIDFLSVNIIL